MVRQLFTNPRAYLQGKAQERSIALELVVLILVGAVGALGHYYINDRLTEFTRLTGYSNFTSIGYIIEPITGLLLFWLGGAIVMNFVAGFYNGRGPIRRLLKLSAWAMVPFVVANAVRSAAIWLTFRQLTESQVDLDTGGYNAQLAELRHIYEPTEPFIAISIVVLLLSLVAVWYLLSIAVSISKQGIDEEGAQRTAAVPVVILALYYLYNVATVLGIL